MTNADEENRKSTAPPPFFVYYNPVIHILKLAAILAICIVLGLLPFFVLNIQNDAVRVIGAIVAVFLIWAYLTANRIRDRRPQVVVGTDGIYVRDWHVDIVPWREIDFIAHSSSVRRGIVSALTRSRRGPYLLFKFIQTPKSTPSMVPPFSWLQKIWIDMELQEPAIMEYGLDTKATVILNAIQDHIAYWQLTQDTWPDDTTIVSPRGG
ncbi:MAG: hypothetical protein QF609_10425 [Gammaproteobacteria bacterium]|jgi:hypothetical protein|nr:hypothetical protein [Gammaproteobacteria bacterium]